MTSCHLAGHGGGLEQGGGPGPLGHDGGGGQADGDLAPRVEGGVQVVSVVVNILPNLKQQSIGINHKVTKFHVHAMPNRPAFFKLFMGEDICNFPYIRLYILAPSYRDFVSVPTAVRSCCWCSFPSHYHVSYPLATPAGAKIVKYSRGKIISYKYTDSSSGE